MVGCQLLANTVANNSDTQAVFRHRYLLSSHFLALVRSCPSLCLSSLLYVLHTVLASSAEQSFAVDPAGTAALLAEFTLRLSCHRCHQQRQCDADEDGAEDDVDSGLLFPSLIHRLFVSHSSLLQLLSDSLQHHHPDEAHSAVAYLLSTLVSLSPSTLEVERAAECACDNSLSLLSLLLARYATDPSERIEDEASQYTQLPHTLLVDEWTHSVVLLLEHVMSICLALPPSSTPPLPLLRRTLAADVWYVLISLLSSSNTPALNLSQPLPSTSTDYPSPSSASARSGRPDVIPFGFQSDILRLLALLCCYPASHPPPYPRVTALSFLAHTAIHPDQPMQREYSVVGIRGLCRWDEARDTLASMEAQEVEGRDEWRRQGVQLTLDQQSHTVRLAGTQQRGQQSQRVERGVDEADMWSVERMAAVRSAGRRVDWGDTGSDDEPFTVDDFM